MSQDITEKKQNKVILQPIDNPPKTQIKEGQQSENTDKNKDSQKKIKVDEITSRKLESAVSEKNLKKKRNLSGMKLKAKRFMSHKLVQWFIIILVSIYTILIFSVLAIDDLLENGDDKDSIMEVLLIVEITILTLFVLEIALTAYAQGIKFYFRDGWLVFDAVVIFISIIFVIIDLSTNFESSSYKTITSMLRGIFRFVRIFLLIRKVQTFKKIKGSGGIKTAAEKIMDTLSEIKELIEITEILQDLDWAMEMIGSNKLYDPVYNNKGNEEDQWFNQYNVNAANPKDGDGQESGKKARKHTHKIKPIFDKILATIPNKALQMLEKLDDLEFNSVELQQITKGQELSYVIIFLFEQNDLYNELDINHKVLKNFALKIQNGYFDNPYHNSLHGFDVTQTVNFFLKKCKFQDLAQITEVELSAMYLAAAFHDYEHPGVNNPYLIATSDDMAIKYNDISVLESHHVSAAFQLMQNEELDVTQNFSNEDYKRFRELCISIVLSTDMSKHFTDIAKIKGRLAQGDFDILSKDKTMCIDAVVHASDVSNPIKPWEVCQFWTEKIMEEFWNQGDKERALNIPITYLCDKYTTNMPKSQGGFIDFVVKPLYEVISNFIPELTPYLQNFEKNKAKWSVLIPEYEEKLKILNEEREDGQTQANLQ